MAEQTGAPAAKKAVVKKATVNAAAVAAAVAAGFGFSTSGKAKVNARVEVVPYKNVHVEPGFNPRKKIGDISGLEASINAKGLIHFPVVRPYENGEKPGHYRVVAGERRYRALGGLDWDSIPVIIRDDLADDDLLAKAVAMSENGPEARQEMSPEDRGLQYKEFSDQAWPIKKIAKETGAHERDVRRCLELVNAPEDVQKVFKAGKVNFTTALEIAALDDDTRKAALKHFTVDNSEEFSKAQVKAFAKALNMGEDTAPKKASNKKKGKARAASLKAWKGHKVVDKQLAELCYMLVNADEKGTTRWYETRGAIGAILWQHGDVSYPVIVPNDPAESADPKEAKKELKRLTEIIEGWVSKHTPDPEETAADAESAAAADAAAEGADADAETVGAE